MSDRAASAGCSSASPQAHPRLPVAGLGRRQFPYALYALRPRNTRKLRKRRGSSAIACKNGRFVVRYRHVSFSGGFGSVQTVASHGGSRWFESNAAHSDDPLTAVVSGSFPLTRQALVATASVALDSLAAPATLSTIDCYAHDLPVVGANSGANREAVESSVPVALRAAASVCGLADRGSAGKACIAPATSKSFGSV